MFIHLYGMNLLNLFLFFMPVAGLSFYACTIGCGLVLAAAGAAGLVFIRPWLRFLPLRVFLILSAAVWACAAFLTAYGSSDDWAAAGVLFLGIFPFPALLTVPVNFIFSSRHPAPAKACCLGLFSSAAMICVIPFQMIFAYFPGPAIVLLFSMMTVCSVRLPGSGGRSHADMMCRRSRRSVYCCFRIRAFTFLSSFCAAGPLSAIWTEKTADLPPILPLIAGAAAGPVLTAAVIAKKGIYAGSIFFIFLLELSSMGMAFAGKGLFIFSSVMAGAAFSSVFLACPAAAYYYLGLSSSLDDGTSSAACIMAGAAISHIFFRTYIPLIWSPVLSLCLTALSVVDFFIIFSAWRHRFVLLK